MATASRPRPPPEAGRGAPAAPLPAGRPSEAEGTRTDGGCRCRAPSGELFRRPAAGGQCRAVAGRAGRAESGERVFTVITPGDNSGTGGGPRLNTFR